MEPLTSRERITRILNHEPTDRLGIHEHFWGDTAAAWRAQGHIGPDETLEDHFDLDIRRSAPFKVAANLDTPETLVEETEDTRLVRDGNGALLRYWKHKSGTPERVEFLVQDRAGWETHCRDLLLNQADYGRRIDFEAYRRTREAAAAGDRFMVWGQTNVFELMHPVCGHENLLMGMALDPDWVVDMCTVYADLLINLMEMLFDREGRPDGIWFYEDMGFKGKPFMSPQMYRDLVWPAHRRTFDYAHSIGCPVFVHSCGYVEPLVPDLIAAGMDCLQAIEVKAGMDLIELKRKYGDTITLMGGIDIRTLESNDLDVLRRELEAKVPAAAAGSGFVLHTDHSVSTRIDYRTFRQYLAWGTELARGN